MGAVDQAPEKSRADLAWHITRRWQSYEGEIRVAILRVALLTLFYTIQLVHYLGFSERTDTDILFHRQITFLAAGWLFVSLAVLVALRQRFFPPHLKFVTSLLDLLLLSTGAALGSGPASPLIGCYFLIIAMSALRFSLPLAWLTSLGAMACYWGLVGLFDASWFDASHATPPVHQMVVLSSLAATGIATGQLVRMVRSTAENYVQRLHHLKNPVEATSPGEVSRTNDHSESQLRGSAQ